jgi:hypothetical protein
MFRFGLSIARVASVSALLLCAPLGLLLDASVAWGQQPGPKTDTIAPEFAKVEPILQARCVRCHGVRNMSAGLRLDAFGATKNSRFASRDPEQNELFARLTATDPKVRMPLGSPALTSEELAAFRAWIEAGQPWPVRPGSPQAMRLDDIAAGSPWIDVWVDALTEEMEWLWPRGLVAAAMLLGILVFERLKLRSRAGRWPRWGEWRERFGQGAYLAVLSVIVLVGVIHAYHARVLWLEQKLADSRVQLLSRDRVETAVVETPPQLIRPPVPKRLQATYYRGNCERNAALFNGGNYLTAYMRLALYGRSETPLTAGDDVTGQELSVEFEIEKAPGATDELFASGILSTVRVTTEYPRQASDDRPPTVEPRKLEETEAGQRWKVRVPVGQVGAAGCSGVIYICKDNTAHYGIQYDLKTAEGRLTADCDLWMSALYLPAQVAQPQLLPFREWLDHEPLPVITGPNSTDPKLLGIDEHVRTAEIGEALPEYYSEICDDAEMERIYEFQAEYKAGSKKVRQQIDALTVERDKKIKEVVDAARLKSKAEPPQ